MHYIHPVYSQMKINKSRIFINSPVHRPGSRWLCRKPCRWQRETHRGGLPAGWLLAPCQCCRCCQPHSPRQSPRGHLAPPLLYFHLRWIGSIAARKGNWWNHKKDSSELYSNPLLPNMRMIIDQCCTFDTGSSALAHEQMRRRRRRSFPWMFIPSHLEDFFFKHCSSISVICWSSRCRHGVVFQLVATSHQFHQPTTFRSRLGSTTVVHNVACS